MAMLMRRICMTRCLIILLPLLLLKPHPGETGKEITKGDMMSPEENIIVRERYVLGF